jgi:uncharacterized protein YjbI with pentapeptide repeats
MKEKLLRFIRRPVVKWTLILVASLSVLLVLIWIGYYHERTGFGWWVNSKGELERAKTLWDWLDLLIVPAVLALGALGLNWAARRSEREIAQKRREQEQNLASQASRAATLQSYLDKMTDLLLENELRESEPDSEVQYIARARTLTVLEMLDPWRKRMLLVFLHEAGLIRTDEAVVNLRGAFLGWANLGSTNLSNAELVGVLLPEASLYKANLAGANLSEAILHRADLRIADVIGANFSEANLIGADLREAILQEANLKYANLSEADLTGANLTWADLREAVLVRSSLTDAFLMHTDLIEADLTGANLREAVLNSATLVEANLSSADLSSATLVEANLSSADLTDANLSGANLSRADLNGAKVTDDQLNAVASLEGATMPDGTKHD